MNHLIQRIKQGKYMHLPDELIQDYINKYLKQKPKAKEKEVIKAVKTNLHKVYGQYQTKQKKQREQYLTNPDKILKTAISTKERLKYYSELYSKIFKITGKPNSILDIGSGMNPASYKYLGINPKYTAIEISQDDVDFLNKFFKANKINGEAILLPVNENTFHKLPQVNIVFLFKVIDVLELQKGHKFAEKIIKALKAKYIVASFSTMTISQKLMKHPCRGWLERLLARLGLNYQIIEYPNEIFYIITKSI